MNSFGQIILLCLVLAVMPLWLSAPETIAVEHQEQLWRFPLWVCHKACGEPDVRPPRSFTDIQYVRTLILDPTYEAPGNLVQQLSTQSPEEKARNPHRVVLIDAQGKHHYYKVRFDR